MSDILVVLIIGGLLLIEEQRIYFLNLNNKRLIDPDFMIRWKLLQSMYREQDIKFRLIAWDKKIKEFIEL